MFAASVRISAKLFQEAQVVAVEETDVVDAVFHHGDALRAHAEGEALDALGIVARVAQHERMHHARAEELDRAAALADATARAATDVALDGHVEAGLHEREIITAKAT